MRKMCLAIGFAAALLITGIIKPEAVEKAGAYVVAIYASFATGNAAVHIGNSLKKKSE